MKRMTSSSGLAAIDALDSGMRGGPDQHAIDLGTFNRPIPEA
jgi:hypothetical protein